MRRFNLIAALAMLLCAVILPLFVSSASAGDKERSKYSLVPPVIEGISKRHREICRWQESLANDSKGKAWRTAYTELIKNGLVAVRFRQPRGDGAPALEWGIYKKLPPEPPKESPETTAEPKDDTPTAPTDVPQGKCQSCHPRGGGTPGGGGGVPGGGGSSAGGGASSGGGGSDDDSSGGGASSAGGGSEDGGGGDTASGGSGADTQGGKSSGGMGGSLPDPKNGDNPWKTGELDELDPKIWKKEFGGVLKYSPSYSIPLGGDSRRRPQWLYVEAYRDDPDDPTSPILARFVLLQGKAEQRR